MCTHLLVVNLSAIRSSEQEIKDTANSVMRFITYSSASGINDAKISNGSNCLLS